MLSIFFPIYYMSSSQRTYTVGVSSIVSLKMRKQREKDVRWLAQGQARMLRNWDLHQVGLTPEPTLLNAPSSLLPIKRDLCAFPE